MLKTAVILPTLNEEHNIEERIRSIFLVDKISWVIVVDDSSKDKTQQIVEKLQSNFPNLVLIRRVGPKSFSQSYKEGFARAVELGAEILIQMDADGSHSEVYLERMLEEIQTNDFVIGSRYIKDGGVAKEWNIFRKLLSWGGNWFARTLLNVSYKDMTGGFNVWRAEVIKAIDLSGLHYKGYVFLTYLKYIAFLKKFKGTEVPIIFSERQKGKSKFNISIILESLVEIIKLSIKNRTREEKLELSLAFIFTLLIVLFHLFVLIKAGPLWRDEATSAVVATRSFFSSISDSLRFDSFPVLGPVIFYFFSHVSASDMGWRLFGLVIGLLILGAIWINARSLKLSLPFFGLIIFGFNPIVLRYGDSIRPYGLSILFILLSIGLIYRQVIETWSWKKYLISTICCILAVQSAFTNSFLVFNICIAAVVITLIHKDYKKTWSIFSIGLISAISMIPYLNFIHADWRTLMQYPTSFERIWTIMMSTMSASGYLVWLAWLFLPLLALVLFVAHISEKEISTEKRDLFIFAVATSVLSMVTLVIFFRLADLISSPWYYLALLAVLVTGLDIMFAIVFEKQHKFVRTVIIILLFSLSITKAWSGVQVRTSNVDLVASYLNSESKSEDLVIVTPWYMGVSFNRYSVGPSDWVTLPMLTDVSIHRYDLFKKSIIDQDQNQEIFDSIQKRLSSGNNVWLVQDSDFKLTESEYISLPKVLNPFGLDGAQYQKIIRLNLNTYLSLHSKENKNIVIESDQEVSTFENLSLTKFSGWQ